MPPRDDGHALGRLEQRLPRHTLARTAPWALLCGSRGEAREETCPRPDTQLRVGWGRG